MRSYFVNFVTFILKLEDTGRISLLSSNLRVSPSIKHDLSFAVLKIDRKTAWGALSFVHTSITPRGLSQDPLL